ncbi:MAG: hypothetical protein VBE63_30890 [Lamprobacter sp.]|uniref:hypothetical protein n=1 Tax=Lamprobacter sp. TaxID=3100796 RepID=UPI002B25A93F|nr:hypothetical protein [Lamprobacter sp.]MEA3644297.1 hypothetical protein [Lamprobacter sp.]
MTIDQLIPSVNSLTHAEKIRLAQVVLEQLALEALASPSKNASMTNPLKGSVTFEKDIVSPIDLDWNAIQAQQNPCSQ